jgi:hypothetical protein
MTSPAETMPPVHGNFDRDAALRFARACADAAGLGDRIEVSIDPRGAALSISGPDQFGFLGTTAWRTLKLPLPTNARAIGIATARHVFGEFYATDDEIAARGSELPLAIAMALEEPPE